jgi:hypothetical protein
MDIRAFIASLFFTLLGLPHTDTGVMQPNVQFGLLPGQAEFAVARRFWFGEE